jgi:hypothetical protein
MRMPGQQPLVGSVFLLCRVSWVASLLNMY